MRLDLKEGYRLETGFAGQNPQRKRLLKIGGSRQAK